MADQTDDDGQDDGYHGQCQACDEYGSVNDISLCPECAGKFERDVIRQRDWDYSVEAFGLNATQREELRTRVIAEYGKDLEMLAPAEGAPGSGHKSRKRPGRR